MAGGHVKYRTLGRNSAHRQQLLRHLVTSLFSSESISTTWPKAKETQKLAEKLITLAKRNTDASRRRAGEILYTPIELVPKLFSTIRERYLSRPGGYTRVLRIEPLKVDQAPSAILELVDGPKDMRFALTAQTVARDRKLERFHSALTLQNKEKVLRYRENGEQEFEAMVQEFIELEEAQAADTTAAPEPQEGEQKQQEKHRLSFKEPREPRKKDMRSKEYPDSNYLLKNRHMNAVRYKQIFEHA